MSMRLSFFATTAFALLTVPVLTGGAAAQDIKIGVIEPLTGAFAASGTYVTNGAKIAADEINAKGGVLGRKIQLVIEDNKSNPTEAAAVAEKLITRDKVPVMMGAWGSSLTLAVMHVGDEIVTIEGIGATDRLHPLQRAFLEHDGFQCGYCTSGQICSAIGMLGEVELNWPSHATADVSRPTIELDDREIRERMSGNLCRCAAYPNIVAAIRDVAVNAAP